MDFENLPYKIKNSSVLGPMQKRKTKTKPKTKPKTCTVVFVRVQTTVIAELRRVCSLIGDAWFSWGYSLSQTNM